MESESPAAGLDTDARLARARSTVDSAATRIKNSLGSIIALTGMPMRANQALWRRLDAFASADLKTFLDADAQADIADHLRLLLPLHNRLADTRWVISTSPAESPDHEAVTGHGGGAVISTTLPAIELLAEVFATVAGIIESIDTRLAAQILFDTPIPDSARAYVREIHATVARVSTQPDAAWAWEWRADAGV